MFMEKSIATFMELLIVGQATNFPKVLYFFLHTVQSTDSVGAWGEA